MGKNKSTKDIQKIGHFCGESAKWDAFQEDVEKFGETCHFDSETMKTNLKSALKGEAFKIVQEIFDTQSVDVIMNILKSTYGVVKRMYQVSPYHVDHNTSSSGSLKIFKVKIFGPKGYVTAHVVESSGSNVTLMHEDLREALGIQGTPVELGLQYFNGSGKCSIAMRCDVVVQGTSSNCKAHTLKDCYAINSLYLPERSLDILKIKEEFPYLAEADIDSFFNEAPVMLIGCGNLHLTECIGEMLTGDGNSPIGHFAKLGWTVFGGTAKAYGVTNTFFVGATFLAWVK